MSQPLPYKLAVLVYIYDDDGDLLLLHRSQSPNAGFYSPIGGKLHLDEGEGPHECAVREIAEETGLVVSRDDIHLTGIISECAYEGETHWLIFLFELTRPIAHDELKWMEFREGALEWIPIDEVEQRNIPETDRLVMWQLVQQHRGGGFFMAHIDCREKPITWTVTESHKAAEVV